MHRRMPAIRAVTAAGFGGVAAGLVAVSVAWACVPQPLLIVKPPASARAGDRITLQGVDFRGSAEIRIDGIDGARLATGDGGDFSVRLRVPSVRPGIHTLVAVARSPGGELSGTASAPLQIVAAGGGRRAAGASAAGGGSAAGTARSSSSSGISPSTAVAAGIALLALGALLGGLLARRRAPRTRLL